MQAAICGWRLRRWCRSPAAPRRMAIEGNGTLWVPLYGEGQFPLELEFAHAGQLTIEVTSRFHSPNLTRRIRAAARRGDIIETLHNLRDAH